jgi:hypothetical protein
MDYKIIWPFRKQMPYKSYSKQVIRLPRLYYQVTSDKMRIQTCLNGDSGMAVPKFAIRCDPSTATLHRVHNTNYAFKDHMCQSKFAVLTPFEARF